MARPLRIEYPGALYHVTSRGNAREAIYRSDEDRLQFLDALAQVVDRFGWLCHAFCLMDNHYHLLIETPQGNLSRGMRQLNGVYTQRFNRSHGRVGHVFQGRFKAIVVEKDAHLLALCRYIVRNPVAAGMVSEVGDWPWSSYRATAGVADKPAFLTAGWALEQFGGSTSRYVAFVADAPADDAPLRGVVGSHILGDEEFRQKMQELAQGGREVPRAQRIFSRPTLAQIAAGSSERGDWMSAAYRQHGYTMRAIAEQAGVHYSLVGKIIRAWEQACATFET